jgi:hypothetical protein
MTKLFSPKEMIAQTVADIMYGLINLLYLTPEAKIAMISEFSAILEVQKITAIKMKSGLNRLT